MIFACLNRETLELQEINASNQSSLKEAIWIDLLAPSKEDEDIVENTVGLDVPTREEMQEIELSSRLYRENGTIVMTATMIAHADSPNPKLDPVTFVLTQERLITIRYIDPQSFTLFISRLKKVEIENHNAIGLFIEILDATISRLADILELVGKRLNDCSVTIFRPESDSVAEKLDYRQLMQQVGANGDLNAKARDSLNTLNRLLTFFMQTAAARINPENQLRLQTLSKDIASLSDHATFISTKVNFLLDATLGLVNIEQNNIIKIFSVAAVIFLPPTLIASIYGMNFKFMPELSWKGGYLVAISLMLVSAWLPYKYFKSKKWL
jgi:magnesium transporter